MLLDIIVLGTCNVSMWETELETEWPGLDKIKAYKDQM